MGTPIAIDLTSPLIDRERETGLLRSYLHKAVEGAGRTVLISGETGIGKTRLAAELIVYAGSLNVLVLFGRAVPHNQTPYLVFMDALEELFRTTDEEKATSKQIATARKKELGIISWILGRRTLREDAETDLEPEVKRERLFESVARLLLRTSKRRAVLMVLDDLQWADAPSLGILHYLARNISSTKVLLIGSYRSEELAGEGEAGTVLLDELRLMRREGLIEEVALGTLALQDVSQLVKTSLRADPPQGLVDELIRLTEGNPLFVIETLKLLIQEGLLTRSDGAWELERSLQNQVPSRVYEVIVRRLERLSPSNREVIDCAAVIGDHFESRTLETAMKIERTKLLKILGELERRHRLIHFEKDRYHFEHSMIREVLYDELGEELRRQYHQSIAESLLSIYKEEFERPNSLLAYHYTRAGLTDKAAHSYRLAAEELAVRGELDAAQDDAKRGIEALEGSDSPERGWLELVKSLIAVRQEEWDSAVESSKKALEIFIRFNDPRGEVQALQSLGKIETGSPKGDSMTAEKYLTEALNKSILLNDPEFTVSTQTSLAHLFAYRLGDIERSLHSISIIERSLNRIRDPHKRLSFLMLKGWINLKLLGDYSAAETSFLEALSLARRIHDSDSAASARYGLTCSAYYQGQLSEALPGFERFSVEMKEKVLQSYAVESTCMAAECCLLLGDLAGFDRLMRSLEDLGLPRAVEARIVMFKPLRGIDLMLQGRREEALACFREAVKLAENESEVEYSSFALLVCGVALRVLGQDREANLNLTRSKELLELYGRLGILDKLKTREDLLRKTLSAATT